MAYNLHLMAARPDVLNAMDDARVVVPHVIRTLMKARGMPGPQIARALGMSTSSFYARLNGVNQISTSELAALAVIFDVPVDLFFNPPGWVTRLPTDQYVTRIPVECPDMSRVA